MVLKMTIGKLLKSVLSRETSPRFCGEGGFFELYHGDDIDLAPNATEVRKLIELLARQELKTEFLRHQNLATGYPVGPHVATSERVARVVAVLCDEDGFPFELGKLHLAAAQGYMRAFWDSQDSDKLHVEINFPQCVKTSMVEEEEGLQITTFCLAQYEDQLRSMLENVAGLEQAQQTDLKLLGAGWEDESFGAFAKLMHNTASSVYRKARQSALQPAFC